MLVADIANLATFLFNNQKFLITLQSWYLAAEAAFENVTGAL